MIELIEKVTLDETTDQGPALGCSKSGLLLAWKGAGNDQLNAAFEWSGWDAGLGLPAGNKVTFGYGFSSDRSPALAAHGNELYMAWKGSGNENLSVARVDTYPGDTVRGRGLADKHIFEHTTDQGPAIGSSGGVLYLAWKGAGNDNLNVAFSEDNGASFPAGNKATYEDSSDSSPALATGQSIPFLAWKGSGNEHIGLAGIPLFPGGRGGSLDDKHVLGDTTEEAPALAFHEGRLFLAWKGAGNDNLTVKFSNDNGATFSGSPLAETSDRSPALASCGGNLYIAWKGSGNQNLNVGRLSGWTHAGPLPPREKSKTHTGPLR